MPGAFDLTNANVSETFKHLLQVRDDDKTLFDALGNTLDDFKVEGSFTATEFLELENSDAQTGNKLHSRSGTLYWGNINLQTGGSGISNMVEDTTPQLGGSLDLNSKDINGTGNFLIAGSGSVSELNVGTANTDAHFTITPSTPTKDFMLIKSGSFNAFKVNQKGVAQFGSFSAAPSAVEGGMYYNTNNNEFYLGV